MRAGLAPRLPAPAAPLVKAADLYHQASTRGGRAVDAVLAGKAVFKEGMLAVGGAMVDLGLAVAHTVKDKDDDTAALIGLGFIVSGVAAAIAGAAAWPAADVRALDVLPHSIFLATDRTDGAAAPRSVPARPSNGSMTAAPADWCGRATGNWPASCRRGRRPA